MSILEQLQRTPRFNHDKVSVCEKVIQCKNHFDPFWYSPEGYG
jgi:hypothetical protein